MHILNKCCSLLDLIHAWFILEIVHYSLVAKSVIFYLWFDQCFFCIFRTDVSVLNVNPVGAILSLLPTLI